MVKICFVVALFTRILFGGEFDDRCLSCHSGDVPDLENLYFRYMQIHGSTKRAKSAMKNFLLNPKEQDSIMPPQALHRFGIHKPVEAPGIDAVLDRYFEIYELKNRIKFVK